MRHFVIVLLLSLVLTGCKPSVSPDGKTDQASAYVQNKGSDTMVNLALAWAERYQSSHPDVRLSVTGGGTGTGITALLSNTVDIANASRAIKPEEIDQAKKNGVTPKTYVVARDAIAVIVNPDNPVKELTLQQIAKIYRGDYNNWREVGGENRPIVRLSRETNSGTHVYFLESVVRLGDKKDKSLFSLDTLLLPSSEGIISEVRDNPNAIGYDGLGYVIPEVKVLAISKKAGEAFILPSAETVNAGKYPIARDLYMYAKEDCPLPVKAYLEWVMTSEAQQIVSQLGFVPVR